MDFSLSNPGCIPFNIKGLLFLDLEPTWGTLPIEQEGCEHELKSLPEFHICKGNKTIGMSMTRLCF